jgi:hypothetical protein
MIFEADKVGASKERKKMRRRIEVMGLELEGLH